MDTTNFGFVVPISSRYANDGLLVVGWITKNIDEGGGGPAKLIGRYLRTKPEGTKLVEAYKSEYCESTKPEDYRYAKVLGYIVSPAAGKGFVSAAGVVNDAAFQGRMQPIGWLLQEA